MLAIRKSWARSSAVQNIECGLLRRPLVTVKVMLTRGASLLVAAFISFTHVTYMNN